MQLFINLLAFFSPMNVVLHWSKWYNHMRRCMSDPDRQKRKGYILIFRKGLK